MSEREQVWRELIESQPWSGQTVAEWCEGASVSIASFYRWKKLLVKRKRPGNPFCFAVVSRQHRRRGEDQG